MQLQGRQLWRDNSLLVLVVGRLIFLGLVELTKESGLNVEEECSNEEAAEVRKSYISVE